MQNVQEIISSLKLLAHPEGGYYRETFRSESIIPQEALGPDYSGDRNTSTMIYFLLTADTFSAFHRILQDEAWHFYAGDTITLHTIDMAGVHEKHLIGADFEKGEVPQLMVKGGDWFAASISKPDGYALVGCTVSPGFDFQDFELADRKKMSSQFPAHSSLIECYTRIN